MTTFSNRDKHAEAKREAGLRHRVYQRFVLDGKMPAKTADKQIAVMEAIAEDYRILAELDEAEERLL